MGNRPSPVPSFAAVPRAYSLRRVLPTSPRRSRQQHPQVKHGPRTGLIGGEGWARWKSRAGVGPQPQVAGAPGAPTNSHSGVIFVFRPPVRPEAVFVAGAHATPATLHAHALPATCDAHAHPYLSPFTPTRNPHPNPHQRPLCWQLGPGIPGMSAQGEYEVCARTTASGRGESIQRLAPPRVPRGA